jgi:hypothetical protein
MNCLDDSQWRGMPAGAAREAFSRDGTSRVRARSAGFWCGHGLPLADSVVLRLISQQMLGYRQAPASLHVACCRSLVGSLVSTRLPAVTERMRVVLQALSCCPFPAEEARYCRESMQTTEFGGARSHPRRGDLAVPAADSSEGPPRTSPIAADAPVTAPPGDNRSGILRTRVCSLRRPCPCTRRSTRAGRTVPSSPGQPIRIRGRPTD